MEEYFTTKNIVTLGIPKGRFREWLNSNFITPSIEKAAGPGTKSRFSRNDVYGIALFDKLLKNGLSREVASEYVSHFVQQLSYEPEKNPSRIILGKDSEGNFKAAAIDRRLESKLNINTGGIETGGSEQNPIIKISELGIFSLGKDWDILIVINFESIVKYVDDKLEI